MICDNPFYILNIPMVASAKEIANAAETQSLVNDEKSCRGAMNELLNPARRLKAEFDWFPQEGENVVLSICEAVRSGQPIPDELMAGSGGLGRINAMLYDLSLEDPDNWADHPYEYGEKIGTIGSLLDVLDIDTILEAVNEERSAAGISPASRDALVAEAGRKFARTADLISSLTGKMTTDNALRFMNSLADIYEKDAVDDDSGKATDGARLFCALADRFEAHTTKEYNTLSEKLKSIENAVPENGIVLGKSLRLKKYMRKLDAWLRYDRPLQVSAALRGDKREERWDILVRSAGMLFRTTKTNQSLYVYECLNELMRKFAAVPAADLWILIRRRQVEELITEQTGCSAEEALRKERERKRKDRNGFVFEMVVFLAVALFAFVSILTAPPELEQANDPSTDYYYEVRKPNEVNAHGDYQELKVPPTGFVFQDTMGDSGRSVTLTIKGFDNMDSFVRISDRDCGSETYIDTPEEDARILSIMVREGDETTVTLPPGEYLISRDTGGIWYGWDLRFQKISPPGGLPSQDVRPPEMRPLSDEPYAFEEGNEYSIDLDS